MFESMRRRRRARDEASRIYATIVRQTRDPALYTAFGVPDTFDGRFDLLVLHTYLVVRQLGRHGVEGRAVAQALFDVLFRDMDNVLREMGVGDLVVGKRIRTMAEAYYGRSKAYEAGLAPDALPEILAEALGRNVYRQEAGVGRAPALARYVRAADAALGGVTLEGLRGGHLPFPVSFPGEVSS